MAREKKKVGQTKAQDPQRDKYEQETQERINLKRYLGIDLIEKHWNDKSKWHFEEELYKKISDELASKREQIEQIKNIFQLLKKYAQTKYSYSGFRNYEQQYNYAQKIQKTIILDEEKVPEQLDHAFGFITKRGKKDKKRLRYYGVTLNVRFDKDTTHVYHQKPVLILENGEVVRENDGLHQEGVFYFKLNTVMSIKKNRWSLKSIKSFIQNPTQEVPFSQVYKSFKGFYDRNMVFEFEGYYMLNAVWDIATYFQDIFHKYLLIKHEGGSGTAKSKGMKISANLSFNGRKFLCPTPANFFRYRNNNKAVIYIEEAERLFANTKNKDDSLLVEYLNGSYEKGNFVPRQNDKDLNQTDEFDPSGFTRIGAINPLKGALLKRCVVQTMIKAPGTDKRADTEIPTEDDYSYQEARDLCYICCLKNYNQIQEALKDVKNHFGFKNRAWAQIKSLLAIAECIDKDLEEEEKITLKLGSFLKSLLERRDDGYNPDSWEFRLGCALIAHFNKPSLQMLGEGEHFIDNDELMRIFVSSFDQDRDPAPNIKTRGLSNLMNALGFGDYRSRDGTGNKRGYNLSKQKVVEILHRNGVVNDVQQLKQAKTNQLLVEEISMVDAQEGSVVFNNGSDLWNYLDQLEKPIEIEQLKAMSGMDDMRFSSSLDKYLNTSKRLSQHAKEGWVIPI